MRIFMTGATGFIGGRLAARLLADGHQLDLLVRTPKKAAALEEAGASLVKGDITEPESFREVIGEADAVIHAAAIYEIGPVDRDFMRRVNVEGTRNVLEACRDAGVSTTVYVSTIAAKGDTQGEVGDETFEHKGNFCTWYEWTKWKAHQVAVQLREAGLPLRIAMPGAVYGPGDHSAVGQYIHDFVDRKLPARIGEDTINSFVYIDDVVDGLVRVLERGEDGEDYLLAGIPYSFRELNATLQKLTGVRPPGLSFPIWMADLYARGAEAVGRWTGKTPLVTREGVKMMDGITFAFSSIKAIEQLGWPPRELEEGLAATLAARGQG